MDAVLAATRALLTSLEPLSYRERMRRLAAWARTAPDRAQVCADLRTRGPYERRLALAAATVAQDVDGVVAATRDPCPSIRGAALVAALRAGVVVDDCLQRPAAERRLVYRFLRRRRTPAVADAMIARVREEYGDEEAALLLPGCGEDTVRALLPDLEHALRPASLVRWHSGPLLDRVRERLASASPDDRGRIWDEVAGAVLRCDPARVLDLLERYAPTKYLPYAMSAYGRLAAHDPGRLVRLLVAPDRAAWLLQTDLPRKVLRRLVVLPVEELAPLARRLRQRGDRLAALLKAVPPSRRGRLYDLALADVDTTAYVPPFDVMAVLPSAVRIREATRVLGLPRTRAEESRVRWWSAYLAWPDACAALESALRAGDATERANGYALLVAAACRSRDPRIVAEVVARLGRLRNDQDPVRAAALTALEKAAPLLTAEAVTALATLTTDAVQARDSSAQTVAALEKLAAAVLRHHVATPQLRDWALHTIDAVSGDAPVLVLLRFDRILRRGQERMVFDRLRGWVEAGIARGWYDPLFALTRALGKRAWRLPELQDLLRRAIGPHTLPEVAQTAIELWLDDPRARPHRVAEVLDVDPTAVTIPRVWATVCAVRTDLLDRVLDRAPRGRFVEPGLRWVPARVSHVERWLPRQQASFVTLVEAVVADADQEVWRRAAAIKAAAGVPGAGWELAVRQLEAAEVVIAEAALSALARTDRPEEALPVLLRYADSDRARVASYALNRAARYVAPARLVDLLGTALATPAKITSRKETLRLLASYGPLRVMETLLEAYLDPAAHRDVRAAIASAARHRLEAEASWRILEAAMRGSREERHAIITAPPSVVARRHRARYGGLVVEGCRSADPEVRRVAFLQLRAWSPWLAGITELVVERLTDLHEELTYGEADNLLAAGRDRVFGDALTRLVAADIDDDRPGDALADRPARRRVELLVHSVVTRVRFWSADPDQTALLDAARWLAGHPTFIREAVTTLVHVGGLDNLDEVADLCAGRPVLAAHAADRVAECLRQLAERLDPTTVADTVDRLAGRGDVAGGLIAAVLVGHGERYGWRTPWRDLVLRLRQHPEPDVRDRAYAVDMSRASRL